MKQVFSMLSACLLAVLLTSCATTGNSPTQAEVERISPEELEKLIPPAVATVTLEELLAEAKQGKTPDQIIEKIKVSNSRYELTPEQSVSLNKQGLDIKILNYIHESNALARQNALADEINKRNQANKLSEKKLKRERDLARMRSYDPFWGYGGYYGRPWIGGPFGYGPYGHRSFYGPRFGWGLGYGW
ncbi:MAG: hypothetical protein B7X95_08880 [Methylophilaceae bacterium 17-44-8]|jgi:hypothetical protein|nr:MAG: hypothetical protein B7Y48_00740 [Methylophilales bacterium 28-44-11]OYZ09922.1 MAG: hypothetical protein B7Y32_01450 [Methylophilales bacterium 16-45-7]OZA04809.1 MAG: hypothetical protein B7X95_08880 [Methylophilaceae bacterium 17-44-8]